MTVLEGKTVGGDSFAAALVRASREAGELETERALPAFANLRLRLPSGADLYAKVSAAAAPGRAAVRFTSGDPDATRALEEALAGAS